MSLDVPRSPSPSLLPIYWQATRAFSFPASVVSLLLGTTLASVAGGNGLKFHVLPFLLVLVGGLFAHAGANVFNDYFDFVRGVDTRPEHGSGVLPSGLLTPDQMRRFGISLMAVAALCGAWLLALRPLHTALVGVAALACFGFACALLYPMLLKRYALGDVLIVLSFGLGMPLGAFVAQSDLLDPKRLGFVLLASLPTTALVDAILHANNMRDREDDKAAGVHTLATLLSGHGSRMLQGALLGFPILFVVVGAAMHWLPAASLAALIAVPMLHRAYRLGAVPLVAQAHLVFGVPYALAFLTLALTHARG